jgi:hypothetical protein
MAAAGQSGTITVTVADAHNNPMAAGTVVAVSADVSISSSAGSANQPCATALGGSRFTFSITAQTPTGSSSGPAIAMGHLMITVTSPNGTVTTAYVPVTVQ